MKTKAVSCGVIVTDGYKLLLGHATRSPRWDIPKGIADPGESHVIAAQRELREETSLTIEITDLRSIGLLPYQPAKDLALFAASLPHLPDPATLVCTSLFSWKGTMLPEFDRFGLFSLDEAVTRVGKAMAQILGGISLQALCETSR
ncbi:MAG TPA: NUDIX domain-containing protein [Stellaceae bacterium]|jgi:8-oxo-dGTP pyrophosphatase MutT (NUDIX family)|nr:NUDIX domain-containing protein [Stellaceae bacterium]